MAVIIDSKLKVAIRLTSINSKSGSRMKMPVGGSLNRFYGKTVVSAHISIVKGNIV
jgi:hypothetical protein